MLLLEPSEDAPSPGDVASYLTDLRRIGVMEQIAGLVFSSPTNYRADDVPVLWNVVRDATENLGIPVLGNFDCGHTDPMLTVPLGVEVRLDSDHRIVRDHDGTDGASVVDWVLVVDSSGNTRSHRSRQSSHR